MEKKNTRLNREKWLVLALEVLAEEGKSKIQIDYLAEKLGVTKGSFYSHFSSRKVFIVSVAEYWAYSSTEFVMENVSKMKGSAEERMLSLMKLIKHHDLEKYDIIMRAWAMDEPLVAEQVERVDRVRFEFIKSLFAEMGFAGEELEMRTLVFQVYHGMSHALQGAFFEERRLEHEALRHRFFTHELE